MANAGASKKERSLASTVVPPSPPEEHAEIDIKPAETPKDALKPVSFLRLFRFSTRLEIFLDLVGIVCAFAAGAAQPLMTLFLGSLTNSFVAFGIGLQEISTGHATPEQISAFHAAQAAFKHSASLDALYVVILGIALFFCTYVHMVIWTWTGEVNSRRIRERYFKAVLRQDIAYFDTLGAGEVATRIQTDTHLIQLGMSEKVPLACQFLGAFLSGFILAYIRLWRLALAMSSVLPCMAIAGAVMYRFASTYKTESLKAVAEAGTIAEEVISTVRTAQAFGTQKKLGDIYQRIVHQALVVDRKIALINGAGFGVFFFVIYGAYALAFDFGTTLILEGHGNVGTVINAFQSVLIGSFSLAFLAPNLQAIIQAQAAAAKIFSTIDRVPTIDSESIEGVKLDSVRGEVTLDHVYFTYPSRADVPVLKDLSVRFAPGQTSALVGPSGSGKSTIVALIERFYDPTPVSEDEQSVGTGGGAVKLDGVDLRELNVRWLRGQIGLVSQEPTLFGITIKANVAHGLEGTPWEHAEDEKKFELVKAACVKANADSFIQKLSRGYDTNVGERGVLLSGGQKQRIAIARAIVSDPAILLLDEATSALDTRSEGIVQDALNKASKGRTTIVVAHRLSTIKDANRIHVMSAGALIEDGTHQELINADGAYAKLVKAQKLREENLDDENEIDPDAPHIIAGESITGAVPGSLTTDQLEKIKEDDVPLGLIKTSDSSAPPPGREVASKSRRMRGVADSEYSVSTLFKRMGAMNTDGYRAYAAGALGATVAGLTWPAFSIVYGLTIQGFETTDRHQLRHNGDRNALWFFIIAIAAAFATWIQNYFFQIGASALTYKLRDVSFRSIVKQDISWFDEETNSTGALVSSLADAPQKVNDLSGITLGTIISSITTLISGLLVGFIFGWKLGLVGIGMTPVLVGTTFFGLRVVVTKDQVNKVAHEASAQIACEAAGAIRTVASLTREQGCLREYSESLEEPLRVSNRSSRTRCGLFALQQSIMMFAVALVFWYGSVLVADLEYSTKRFFICLMGVTFSAMQAGNALSFIPDISSAKGAAEDMLRLFDSTPTINPDSTTGGRIETPKGHLQLKDIHFRYPTRPDIRVLRGLNITVEPGSYVAIVGASGSGKSTIIQLIERFYDPQSGQILVDEQDITALRVQDYRKQLALVSQEPTLYAGSLRFNILLGATKPSEEVTQGEIDQVCRDANIYEFIMSLPQKFDTEVGAKGSQLSGGQKQRIAIARALVRNPKILLLDEATSALDSSAEEIVQQALDNAAKGRTTIAIAHRLSTIQNADRIFFIHDGRVAEAGTHDELLRLHGGYYELVQMQLLSNADD